MKIFLEIYVRCLLVLLLLEMQMGAILIVKKVFPTQNCMRIPIKQTASLYDVAVTRPIGVEVLTCHPVHYFDTGVSFTLERYLL